MSLPNTYLQLEYIESTGTQYIDTYFIPNVNVKVKFEVLFNSISGGQTAFIGCQNSSNDPVVKWYPTTSSAGNDFRFGNKSLTSIGNSPNVIYNIEFDKNGIQINNYYRSNIVSSFSSALSQTMYIFAINGNSTTKSSAKLYFCRIYDNDTLVRDFVPAMRLSDKEVGLYDLVNDVFYTNSGTGTFKFAFRNNEEAYSVIKNCEYLQSSGIQWINTGVILTSNMETEMSFILKETGNIYLFGSTPTNRYAISFWNGRYDIEWGTGEYPSNISTINTQIDFNIKSGEYLLNDYSRTTNTSTFTSDEAIIFARGGGQNPCKMQLFSLKIKQNNVLLREYLPVVMNDVGYLYDKVEHKLYGNDGTGSFTYGSILDIEINPTDTGFVDRYYEDGKLNLLATPHEGYEFVNWLLKGYTRLEYIESTGTQYIDIGYITNSNCKIDLDLALTNVNTSNQYISLVGQSWQNNMFGVLKDSSKTIESLYGNQAINTNFVPTQNQKYNFILDKNKFYIDEELKATHNVATFISPSSLIIFASKWGGSISEYTIMKLYDYKLYDNDVLVRNFIPVIQHSTGQIGLLDLVELKFYCNSGTGEFVGGSTYAS